MSSAVRSGIQAQYLAGILFHRSPGIAGKCCLKGGFSRGRVPKIWRSALRHRGFFRRGAATATRKCLGAPDADHFVAEGYQWDELYWTPISGGTLQADLPLPATLRIMGKGGKDTIDGEVVPLV